MSEETAPAAVDLSAPTTPAPTGEAPVTTPAPATTTPPTDLSAPDPETNGMAWLAELDDRHKNDPTIQKYASKEAAFDALINANKLIRQKSNLKRPDDNSSAEDKAAWKDHIGAPASLEGYETPESIKNMSEEGLKYIFGEAGFSPLLEEFHNIDLSQSQINTIVPLFEGIITRMDQEYSTAIETNKAAADQASVNELGIEWGENYKSNLAQYADFIALHPGAYDTLTKLGINNNAEVIQMIHSMATGVGETSINGTRKSTHTMSFADQRQQLTDDKNAGNITVTEYQEKYNKLYADRAAAGA